MRAAVGEIRRGLAQRGCGPGSARAPTSPSGSSAAPIRVAFMGLKAEGRDAMRAVAGGPRLGLVAGRVEERAIREFRMRDPVRARRAGRRSARFRPAAGARAPRTSPCACGRSRRSARARIRARTGPPISPRSAGASAAMTAVGARMRLRRLMSRRQIEPVPRISIQAFCESAEVAAVVSRRRPTADGQGACQAEHGRRGGGGRGLSQMRRRPTSSCWRRPPTGRR